MAFSRTQASYFLGILPEPDGRLSMSDCYLLSGIYPIYVEKSISGNTGGTLDTSALLSMLIDISGDTGATLSIEFSIYKKLSGSTGAELDTSAIANRTFWISGDTGAELDTASIVNRTFWISGDTGAELDTATLLHILYWISGDTGAVLYLRNFLTLADDSNRKGVMKGY